MSSRLAPPPLCSCALSVLFALTGCSTHPREAEPASRVFDAGPVYSSLTPELSHIFKVKNTTNSVVQIVKESHSCTCTSATIAKVRLKPGEATDLELKVRTPTEMSSFDLTCQVHTDPPTPTPWVYHLRFTTLPSLKIEPSRIDLGEIRDIVSIDGRLEQTGNTVKSVWADCYAPTRDSLPALSTIEAREGLSVSRNGPVSIEQLASNVWRARQGISITVDTTKGTTNGTSSSSVGFRTSSGANASASVYWQRKGLVHAIPNYIHFGILDSGSQSQKRTISIGADSNTPFRILSCEGDDAVSVKVDTAASNASASHVAHLLLTPPKVPKTRTLSGQVRIKTDIHPNHSISIPWSAFFRDLK